MNMGAEDKKKLTILGIAGTGGLASLIYIYSQVFGGSTPPPPPAVPVPAASTSATPSTAAVRTTASSGASAAKVGVTSARYDPTLKMQAMLVTEALVYTGSGRNIFSANSAPAPIAIPKPIVSARPDAAAEAAAIPQGPPPLPPIDLKFFGTDTRSNGSLQAFLLHGDDVFLALPGDIVQRRYKIVSISANSIQVEDLTNNNSQSLPLTRF